jgi:hypothetical protein
MQQLLLAIIDQIKDRLTLATLKVNQKLKVGSVGISFFILNSLNPIKQMALCIFRVGQPESELQREPSFGFIAGCAFRLE